MLFPDIDQRETEQRHAGMKRTIARVALLCTVFGAVFGEGEMIESQEDNKIPVIDKCCQKDEVFSIRRGKCVTLEDQVNAELGPFIPPLASVWLGDESRRDVGLSGNVLFPQCDMKTEILQYLLSPGNNVSDSTFLIDDSGLFGVDYALTENPVFYENPYNYTSYCLERGYNSSHFIGTVALVCKIREEVKMCEDKLCISFCTGPPTAPQIPMVGDTEDQKTLAPENITYIQFRPPCGEVIDYEEFNLDFQKGSATAGGTEYSFGEFCLWENATKIAVCPPDDSEGFLKWRKNVDLTMMPILFVISLIFLCILFAHIFVKNRHKLFGTMILCLVSMLCLLYATLILMRLLPIEWLKKQDGFCVGSALFTQFIFISAMFWLNTISFDVWTTFRSVHLRQEGTGQQPTSGCRHRRFKWYALYSWGCPLIVTAVTATMHFLPEEITKDAVVPNLGNRRSDSDASKCYLESGKSMFYYMGIIIIPLLCCNLLLYLSVAWNLCCGIWALRFGDIAMSTQKTRYAMVVKMFFAMGIPWILEFIIINLNWYNGPQAYKEVFTVFKIIIGLQGFILFCAIVIDLKGLTTLCSCILNFRQAASGLFNRHREYNINQPGRRISLSTGDTPVSSLNPDPEMNICLNKPIRCLNSQATL